MTESVWIPDTCSLWSKNEIKHHIFKYGHCFCRRRSCQGLKCNAHMDTLRNSQKHIMGFKHAHDSSIRRCLFPCFVSFIHSFKGRMSERKISICLSHPEKLQQESRSSELQQRLPCEGKGPKHMQCWVNTLAWPGLARESSDLSRHWNVTYSDCNQRLNQLCQTPVLYLLPSSPVLTETTGQINEYFIHRPLQFNIIFFHQNVGFCTKLPLLVILLLFSVPKHMFMYQLDYSLCCW